MLTGLNTRQADTNESRIVEMLEFRFGDGMIYFPKSKPDSLFSLAIENGFIDPEGYLTRKGRKLLAKYQYA
ncbi:MAG: hypothetical protein V3R68_03080 [Gammaproteobacteria bacterium]